MASRMRESLQRELAAAKEELKNKNRELEQAREDETYRSLGLYVRLAKLHAELEAMEPLKKEEAELRAEVQGLNTQDLSAQVQSLKDEHAKLVAENHQIPKLRDELDELHQELHSIRHAIEYKKMVNNELVKENCDLEKSITKMACEKGELRRIDLARSEQRPPAFAPSGGPYGRGYNDHADSFPQIPPASYREGNGSNQGFSYGSSSASRGGVDKH